ncbi:hypothetical protein BH24CHL8_BH24CHL8_08980 [soil metagenome]
MATRARPRTAPAEQPAELTVLFDRDCGFCNWTVRQLRGLDRNRRLRYVSLQSAASLPDRPELAMVAATYPLAEAIHVVRRDGTVQARGRAVLAILDVLPGAWLLRPWTRLPGVARLADALYDPVARNRLALGRLVARDDPAVCDVAPAAVPPLGVGNAGRR